MGLRVEVLGPLRLLVDGRAVDVRGQKRRATLALLALAERRTVPVNHLVAALWPDGAHDSGRTALHSHVFRLRGHLGPAANRLETRQEGYRLDLGPDGLDVAQARALLAAARTALARDPVGALAALRQAYGLWRGPMLADLADVAPIAAAVEGHAHLRREVVDTLLDAALAAGSALEVVTLAAATVAEDPLREPAVLRLMRVLASSGRAADALRTGREFRERLADETGLDPSSALGELVRTIAAGSPAPRPALATGSATGTKLYGRDAALAALQELVAAPRLVSVVGPGGVGKTRLAVEVARRHRAATVLRLAPVTEAGAIPHALAAALRLAVVQGDPLAACLAVLADGPGLLVVDNCEHLLDAARDLVATVLAECPQIAVLVTSREPLSLAAEHVHRLMPLALPRSGEEPQKAPSVAVFLDRAGRVRSAGAMTSADVRLVVEIVRRLDGIPLAIELAAGRLSTFSVADLHQRLDRSLDLLGGQPSGEARHATLRETIGWSYRLLSPDEQRLFRHLAVFSDGADLATVERLATDLGVQSDPGSLLARLVDASMLNVSFAKSGESGTEDRTDGGTRYRMLETLRAYAADRLAAEGETEVAIANLLRWSVDLTQWIGTAMDSELEPQADATLRRELPNLRTAWRLARDRGEIDACTVMVSALRESIAYRDLLEIRDWAQDLAGDPALAGHPREADVLANAAEVSYHRGDYDRAEQLARAALDLPGDQSSAWYCLTVLAVVALARGAFADVIELSLDATARRTPPRDGPGLAALAAAYRGDPERARTLHEPGRAAAVSPTMRAWASYVDGEIDNCAGDDGQAERHYLSAIELARSSGASFLVGVATVGLLSVRARSGRTDDALRGYREVTAYFARTGNWTHLWTTLRNLADLLRRLGDSEPAAVIDAAADLAPDAPAAPAAPAVPAVPRQAEAGPPVPSRTALLDLARAAIDRNLGASSSARNASSATRSHPR